MKVPIGTVMQETKPTGEDIAKKDADVFWAPKVEKVGDSGMGKHGWLTRNTIVFLNEKHILMRSLFTC